MFVQAVLKRVAVWIFGSYGLDFCLPLYHLNFYKYFLCFEKLVFCLWNDSNSFNFSEFTNRLQSVAFKHFHGFKPFKVFSSVFPRGYLSVLKKLALNKDIVVCKPDKGNGIVLIDRPKYVQSMIAVISDATKFEPIVTPIGKYVRRTEDKINNFLLKMKNLCFLFEIVFNNLFGTGSGPGVLYGLPKVYKPDFSTKFPFHPIFCCI